jgi:ATP-dependent helicase HepA
LRVGNLVEHKLVPGIGRVGEIDGDKVRVDCFESVVEPVAESWCVKAAECRRVTLQDQTRVYWQNPDTGAWRTGRKIGGDPSDYFIRLPNSEYEVKVPESQLRVRWDRPVRDPVAVLVGGANESGYYSNTRIPMMRSLIAQRAACGSAFSLLSSSVEIFPHQIRAAMTVISDPVQRYLLADEVGLGKTIEAGYVIRQVLLDEPMSHIVIIAPDALRRQWLTEMVDKFLVSDFPVATIKVSSHDTPEVWKRYRGYDLVVVDEAHLLAQVDGPDQSPYREIATLAHSAKRLLLLSATPLTSRVTTHLALLHLLDPDMYKWTERAAFERKFELRKQLAEAVFALNPRFASRLPYTIERIGDLIREDPRFQDLARRILVLLTDDGDLRDHVDRNFLAVEVEGLRAHISETYRLHRRMIRHRRRKVTGSDGSAQSYTLTGRMRPTRISLDTAQRQAAEDALLAWQAGIADWLLDEGREDEAAAYGQVLGVLVSRVDGASSDLADALRWRLKEDESAADRAGLTSEERAILTAALPVPLEKRILDNVTGPQDGSGIRQLAEALRRVLTEHEKVLVFCGAGSLAVQLAAAVQTEYRALAVGEHTFVAGAEASDETVRGWRRKGGVLFADSSAEEGLNLQVADAVVHLRLPWSPNRLEQRIGRVDRYQAGIPGPAPAQYVVSGGDGEFTLPGAWLSLLDQGFGIFSESVSALQDTIDQGLAAIWAAALQGGPDGLSSLAERVAEDLARERREIDKMDMLDGIHDARVGVVDIAAAIDVLEGEWRQIQAATISLAGSGGGGLGFRDYEVGPDGRFTQFERGYAPVLVPPRILARGGRQLSSEMMKGAFSRTAALRVSGTRVLRSGNPFIDMLARTVWIDDRGQATVTLRCDPRVNGAIVYFGFDFLVEANIGTALGLVGDDEISRYALRRQADCLLAPFTRRVWARLPQKTAVDNPDLVKWLDRPYKPSQGRGNDVNLNAERIGALHSYMGGAKQFTGAAWFAEEVAKRELAHVTDLTAQCEKARLAAMTGLTVRRVQAEARKAASRIVTDTESYAFDIAIADALVAGLATPTIKVISATCLVHGTLPGVSRG